MNQGIIRALEKAFLISSPKENMLLVLIRHAQQDSIYEHHQYYKNLAWVWEADWKISSEVTAWHQEACCVMLNHYPKEQIFHSAPNTHDRFFFLHTLWYNTALDFN